MGLIETSSREWIKTAPLRNLSKFPARVIYSQSHRLRKTYIPFITFPLHPHSLSKCSRCETTFHNPIEFFENKTITDSHRLLLDCRERIERFVFTFVNAVIYQKKKKKKERIEFYPISVPKSYSRFNCAASSSNYEYIIVESRVEFERARIIKRAQSVF